MKLTEFQRRHASRVMAAYIRDRAGQYDPSSGIYDALCQLAEWVGDGSAWEMLDHGELDDLIPDVNPNR